jgi:glycosyltransferase involved in cell wall biosynthesis
MRIAWFSPYSSRSAIGRYSRIVTTELARLHEVEIWTFCQQDLLPSTVPIHSVRSHKELPAAIRDFDIAVYQMGNYWPFHGEIWRQSQRHPGVVVLHDFVMHGFFAEYFLQILRDPASYADSMKRWHGEEGEREAANFLAGRRRPVWEGEDVMLFPMLRGVTDRALGVVSHSRFVVDAAAGHYFGPKIALSLPYESDLGSRLLSRRELDIGEHEYLLVTVGHVNPNKRIDQTVRAIASLPDTLKRRVVYAVLGPLDEQYASSLRNQAEQAGIALRLTGYASAGHMQAYLSHADLCVNLRHPNTEGASASLIEQLLASKAVITNDTGWFRELPADVTLRVALNDTAGLSNALATLLQDLKVRSRFEESAYEYASTTFRADLYAGGLSGFLDSVLRLTAINLFTDAVAVRMQSMNIDPAESWALSIAERAGSLLAGAAGPLHWEPESGG